MSGVHSPAFLVSKHGRILLICQDGIEHCLAKRSQLLDTLFLVSLISCCASEDKKVLFQAKR